MSKTAFITGVTGQDGAYLSEFLLEKGYTVHGLKRRTSVINTSRIDHLYEDPHVNNQRFFLHYGDMTIDSTNLIRIIKKVQPDEIYNLAAMSHVNVSFEMPEYVADVDAIGALRLLEAVRLLGLEKPPEYIKLQPPKCLVKYKKFLKMKPLLSILVRPTVLPNFMPIGQPSTTEKHMVCLLPTASCLITKVQYEEKPCNTKDYPCCFQNSARVTRQIIFREFGCTTRLGTRQRLCSRYVANFTSR